VLPWGAPAVRHHLIADRRDRRPLASDLRGHAHRHLRRCAAVDENVELGLAEHVDEARRDDQPGGVDPRRGRGGLQLTDGRDAIALDADVGVEPRRAAAIDDPATGDQQIEIGRLRPECDQRAHDEEQG